MKLCRARLILLVLVFPLVLRAQNSIVERLDAKERQLEGLYAEYWPTEYQIALDNEHPTSRSIQEKIRAVTRDKQFLDDLKAAHFRDPALNRRRRLFLEEAAYTEISNDAKVTAAVEKITHRENTIRYMVGNRKLTRAQLTDLLTHDPDRQLRQQAWEARAQITSGNGEPLCGFQDAKYPGLAAHERTFLNLHVGQKRHGNAETI